MSAADARIIPGSIGSAQKHNVRGIQSEARDMDLVIKKEWDQLHVDFNGAGLKKRLIAECRVVRHGGAFRHKTAAVLP